MRVPATAVLAALALLANTCGDPCGAPERCVYATLLLDIHDAVTGDPLPQATVSQAGVPLATDFTATTCAASYCTHAVSPAAGPVTISLPGYQAVVIEFDPAFGACGAPLRLRFDIGMRAASDAMPADIIGARVIGSGCG